MEVLRLGVKLEMQLPAYSNSKAGSEPHLQLIPQHLILNWLSETRDWANILMDAGWICFHCATTGTPRGVIINLTLHVILLFFFLFRAAPVAYGGSQTRGQMGATTVSLCHSHSNTGFKLHLWPTYNTAHSKARSVTHWVRPRIEPATLWFLVRFVSSAPQRELPPALFLLSIFKGSSLLANTHLRHFHHKSEVGRNQASGVWAAHYGGVINWLQWLKPSDKQRVNPNVCAGPNLMGESKEFKNNHPTLHGLGLCFSEHCNFSIFALNLLEYPFLWILLKVSHQVTLRVRFVPEAKWKDASPSQDAWSLLQPC